MPIENDPHYALRQRTKAYASRVVSMYVHLCATEAFDSAARIIGKQLIRSGTSVAANHREARHCRSRADRLAKFLIVLQELEESALWLELMLEHKFTSEAALKQLCTETDDLLAIFITSVHTLQAHQDK